MSKPHKLPSPLDAARNMRCLFEKQVPKTVADEEEWRREKRAQGHSHWLSAYDALCLVMEQTHASSLECGPAIEEVFPELFASYWEAQHAKEASERCPSSP